MTVFPRRRIDLQFQLGQGSYGDSGFDTVDVTGLRTSVTIVKAGGAGLNTASVRVWGLSQSLMNQLSIVGNQLINGRNNLLTISAGDEDGMAVAFTGVISQAWGDYQNAPSVPFVISAAPTLYDALKPIPPSSFPEAADVGTIMSGLATRMGLAFRNDGVTTRVAPGAYFAGTAPAQARAVAQAANCNLLFDEIEGAPGLIIWPANGVRGGVVPLISRDTGMVGYPAWTQSGIAVRTLYNPQIAYGSAVDIETTIELGANPSGRWTVFNMNHQLDAEMPNGAWFTQLECALFGQALPNASNG